QPPLRPALMGPAAHFSERRTPPPSRTPAIVISPWASLYSAGVATSLWAAPTAAAPLDATVRLPGSKSMTNRALVIATLAGGPSVIRRPLRSRDTELMVAAVRALGARVEEEEDEEEGTWRVLPSQLRGGTAVDVGNAGTVMRFLLPVAALAL